MSVGPSNQLISSFGAGPHMTQFTGKHDMLNRNGGAMDSVAEMGKNPDGSMNTRSRMEAMKPYFGVSQRQVEEDPYAWWETENYDLPDAYKGKNPYILNIIITAILTSDMWPVTEMLPYKKNEVGMKISWDQWIFSDSMLDRTPEEATSRMTTNTQTSYAQYLVRRGKAFILEHGFWKTPMGQKNWAMNIVQIVNATTETACFGATHAVLTAPPYIDPNERFSNRRQRGMVDVDSMMMEQTDSFARVQKEEGGLATVLRKMDETFRNRNGHEANYVVLPSGCEIAIQSRPENNYAIYNGRGPITPSISAGYGWTTRVSRGYRIGEHSPNCDPHFSTVCIGGFHVMTNQAANLVPIAEYRTQHRTILIFSMSKDDFTPMELGHVFGYLGLYDNWHDRGSPQLSQLGKQFFYGKYMTWGDLLNSSGEKHRAVTKLTQMSDEDYELFTAKFNAPIHTDAAAAIDLSEASLAQASTMGLVDRTSRTVLSKLDAAIYDLVGLTGERYIDFIDNKVITCGTANSASGFAIGEASTLYDVSCKRFLHYSIAYNGGDVDRPLAIAPGQGLDSANDQQREDCLRALLSVAASLMFGMVTYYININTSQDKQGTMLTNAATQICTALYEWLKKTDDVCKLYSSSSKLIHLFANQALPASTSYKTMKQFDQQAKIPFVLLIDYIVLVASTPFDNKVLSHAFKELVAAHLDGNSEVRQGSTGFSFDAVSQNDIYTKAASSLAPGSSRDQSAKLTRDALIEFLATIKVSTEAEIMKLSPIKNASDTAAVNKHLEGFRTRFTTYVTRLSSIWLKFRSLASINRKQATDSWYVRILIIMSKFSDANTASRFLIDIYKSIEATSGPLTNLMKLYSAEQQGPIIDTDAEIQSYTASLNAKTNHIPLTVLRPIDRITTHQGVSPERLTAITDASAADQVAGQSDLIDAINAKEENELILKLGAMRTESEVFDGLNDWCNTHYRAKNIRLKTGGKVEQAMFEFILTTLVHATPHSDTIAYIFIYAGAWTAAVVGAVIAADRRELTQGLNIAHLIEGLLTSKAAEHFHVGCRSQDQRLLTSAISHVYNLFRDYVNLHQIHCWTDTVKLSNEVVVNTILGSNWYTKGVLTTSVTVIEAPPQPKRLSVTQLGSLLDSIPLSNGDWARYSLDHDIPFPIGAIGFRLHKQFDMGSAIMMDAKGQVGYTYFGHADFQLGDDIGKKVHVAHFTVYLKSVVMHPKLIVYARYIISRGYFGGEGTQIYDPLDSDDREDFHSGRVNKDILYAPVLSNFRAVNNVMDVTGKFPPGLSANSDANRSIQYESAEIMRRVWRLNHGKNSNIESGCSQPLHQTLAMQEHTQTWNNQRKGFTDVTLDKGHWGKNKYPGCGAVLKGDGRYLERTIHDQTKTMTIGV